MDEFDDSRETVIELSEEYRAAEQDDYLTRRRGGEENTYNNT